MGKKNKNKNRKKLTPQQSAEAIGKLLPPLKMICTKCGNIERIKYKVFAIAGMQSRPVYCSRCKEPTLEKMSSA